MKRREKRYKRMKKHFKERLVRIALLREKKKNEQDAKEDK